MGPKRWVVSNFDKELAAEISEKYNISAYASLLMSSRGFKDHDKIESFINCAEYESDPFELIDMDRAVNRINKALDNFERIAIYGDYDADGVTATALLHSYLEAKEADVFYYIPDRIDEGYGMNCGALDEIKNRGAKLVVTVDNGITAIDEAEYAKEIGLDLIITDHHQPGENIPDAVAVVNPHRKDCNSEFKDLAGVGVAFKLALALEGAEASEMMDQFGDLVALGTIGDVVPLIEENRQLVKKGLEYINSGDRLGINALIEEAGVAGKNISAITAAFSLVPRINAAGRLGSAERAVKLLLTDSSEEAKDLAEELDSANSERQRIGNKIIKDICEKIAENELLEFDRVIVAEGDEWHHGVLGIAAAKLVEKYGRPCIVLSLDGDVYKGSGRSIEGYSLFEALQSCSQYIEFFGGHSQAAGLSVKKENLQAFRKAINDYSANLFYEMPYPSVKLDIKLNPEVLRGVEFVEELRALEPYGAGNPQPLFGLFNMRLDKIDPVGGGKHLRLTLSKNGITISAMLFGTTAKEFPYDKKDVLDLAAQLDINEYRGDKSLSIIIRYVRQSGGYEDSLLDGIRQYESYRREEPVRNLSEMIPDREDFSFVYRYLRNSGGWNGDYITLWHKLKAKKINYFTMRISLDVMRDLNLISIDKDEERIRVTINNVTGKADLESSQIMIKLKETNNI